MSWSGSKPTRSPHNGRNAMAHRTANARQIDGMFAFKVTIIVARNRCSRNGLLAVSTRLPRFFAGPAQLRADWKPSKPVPSFQELRSHQNPGRENAHMLAFQNCE